MTGEPPVLWGTSIVGFGTYHYRYESGREGDAPLAGFAPRSTSLVKGCLYLKSLAGIDLDVVRELVDRSTRIHRGVDRASH